MRAYIHYIMDFDLNEAQCLLASQVQSLITAGRRTDAIRLAVQYLREGQHSETLSRVVADLIDPDVQRKRGRPKGSAFSVKWPEIGSEYCSLRTSGERHERIIDVLASNYASSPRNIEKLVSTYRAEMSAAYKLMREWDDEFDSWPEHEKAEYYAELAQSVINDPDTTDQSD